MWMIALAGKWEGVRRDVGTVPASTREDLARRMWQAKFGLDLCLWTCSAGFLEVNKISSQWRSIESPRLAQEHSQSVRASEESSDGRCTVDQRPHFQGVHVPAKSSRYGYHGLLSSFSLSGLSGSLLPATNSAAVSYPRGGSR
jgi:hypothetical protein